jgi:hypothetical protein
MDKIDYNETVELHGNADTNPQMEFAQMYDVVLLDTPKMVDAVRTIMKEWVPVRQASAMIRRFDGETSTSRTSKIYINAPIFRRVDRIFWIGLNESL